MSIRFPTAKRTGGAVLATVAILASVLVFTGGAGASTHQSKPGAGDFAICSVVKRATTAYDAKQYTVWRLAMAQIGDMAGSARYAPIKKYALELKAAYDTPHHSTTTTTHKSGKLSGKSKTAKTAKGAVSSGFSLSGLFQGIGGYVGLKKTCATLKS